jgi:hypothetical protein
MGHPGTPGGEADSFAALRNDKGRGLRNDNGMALRNDKGIGRSAGIFMAQLCDCLCGRGAGRLWRMLRSSDCF